MSPKIMKAFLLSKDFIMAASDPAFHNQPHCAREVRPLSQEEERMYAYKPAKMRPGTHMVISQRLGIYMPICKN